MDAYSTLDRSNGAIEFGLANHVKTWVFGPLCLRLVGYYPGQLPEPRGPEAILFPPAAVRGCTRQRAAPAPTLADLASAFEFWAPRGSAGKGAEQEIAETLTLGFKMFSSCWPQPAGRESSFATRIPCQPAAAGSLRTF